MSEPRLRRLSPGLLVSVRNADEAEAALAGGADLIDIKEPSRGSLGKAEDATIAAIVRQVACRRPVSAAMGELLELPAAAGPISVDPGVCLLKFGLAGCGKSAGWREQLAAVCLRLGGEMSRLVAVAYADWRRAEAPMPVDVVAWAVKFRCGAVLFDTWAKDGSTLREWASVEELTILCGDLHAAGIPVALAGGLFRREIEQLRSVGPDWFAVRTSACELASRNRPIDPEGVRLLAAVIHRGNK